MAYSRGEMEDRSSVYAEREHLTYDEELGCGVHGIVFSTSRKSAAKVHGHEQAHLTERDVYHRLERACIRQVHEFSSPRLLAAAALRIIEMTIVRPPFALDFAGAHLDRPPDYSPEVLAEWEAEKREQFGRHWPKVRAVLAYLVRFGVYLSDVNPGNVRFE
jgi:hypothetical protein